MNWRKLLKLNRIKVRVLYWLVVSLLMVFVVFPMFFFFYSFNEDQVKQMLFEQFDSNNYHVEVSGKIAPKFWHGLSFEVDGLQVSTKNDVELLHVKSLSCQLSWFDLAFGNYKIKRMALNDVEINEKNIMNYGMDNLLNWSQVDKSAFNRLHTLTIFGINSVDDESLYPISDGILQIEQSNGSANFKFGFKLEDKNTFMTFDGKMVAISNDIIKFDNFSTNIYNNNMRINLVADTRYNIRDKKLMLQKIEGKLAFDNYSGAVNIAALNISTLGVEGTNAKLGLNFNNDFANQNLSVELGKIDIPKFKKILLDELQFKYAMSIQQNRLNLDTKLEKVIIDKKSVTSNTCVNQLSFASLSLVNNGMKAQLSGVCKYDFNKSLLDFNMKGMLNKAPLSLILKVFNNADKPHILVSGAMDSLDLSRLQVNRDKFMPFYYDDSPLPFSWLSLFDMDGDLEIKRFALDRINLRDVSTKFSLKDQTLNINKLQANVYNGTLVGSGKIAKLDNGYSIETEENITNLDMQEMFEDLFNVEAISGKANLKIDAYINKANSYNDLHKNLSGKISVDANHGAFQGVDFNIFATPKIGFTTERKSTIFEQLKAQFNFIDGVSKGQKVVFHSPYVIANGSGDVDFVNTSLDYKLTIKSALPQNDQQISSVVIPVGVNGDLFNPKITIQNIHLFTGQANVLRAGVPPPKSKHDKSKSSLAKPSKKTVYDKIRQKINKYEHHKSSTTK